MYVFYVSIFQSEWVFLDVLRFKKESFSTRCYLFVVSAGEQRRPSYGRLIVFRRRGFPRRRVVGTVVNFRNVRSPGPPHGAARRIIRGIIFEIIFAYTMSCSIT